MKTYINPTIKIRPFRRERVLTESQFVTGELKAWQTNNPDGQILYKHWNQMIECIKTFD